MRGLRVDVPRVARRVVLRAPVADAALVLRRRVGDAVLPSARCTRRWMVRKPRSTVLLAADVPFALSLSTCLRSLRFSLIKSLIIVFRF